MGDVPLLTKLNTGSTFGSVNPIPVFETAYPQVNSQAQQSFSSVSNSGSAFQGTFQNPSSNLGIPPNGFPSSNNIQADSYGSPAGPILGGQNNQFGQITPSSGFSQIQANSNFGSSVLNGQIVGNGNSAFQSVDSYGSPISPVINNSQGFPATSSFVGPSSSGFNVVPQVANSAVPPQSSYGAPAAPVITNSAPFQPQLTNSAVPPLSSYGAPAAPVISSPAPFQSSLSVYGVTPGPVQGVQSLAPQSQSNYGSQFGEQSQTPFSPNLPLPADSSYGSPISAFDSGPDIQPHPDERPSLSAFIGSLDQSSVNVDPLLVNDPYSGDADLPTSKRSPPSLASTFLHVQGGESFDQSYKTFDNLGRIYKLILEHSKILKMLHILFEQKGTTP